MGESWALGEREICPGDMNIFPSLLATHCSTRRPEAPKRPPPAAHLGFLAPNGGDCHSSPKFDGRADYSRVGRRH